MGNELADYHYKDLISWDDRELQELEDYKQVNDYLKSNDWLFISPIFFQGYELHIFLRLSKSSENGKQKILNVISKKFYDLKWTASFTEGYCSRCTHISPFLKSIEHSLILTFQRDYEGSIKTIIPIIEGILRKYLTLEKGLTNEQIQFKTLKKSFEFLRLDLTENIRNELRNYRTENNVLVPFSEEQIENLTQKQAQYFEVWFSFISDFVNLSFYLKTNGQPLTNHVNRHSILHEFGFDFEYNFENYIKVYFLLQFLTWIFLRKEGKSQLNNIDSFRFLEKVVAYEQIIKNSERLLYDKHVLTKTYSTYNDSILKYQFPAFKNDILPKKFLLLYKLKKHLERLFWKNNIKYPH